MYGSQISSNQEDYFDQLNDELGGLVRILGLKRDENAAATYTSPSATSSAEAVLSVFPGATASHYLLLAISWWPTLGVPAFLTQIFS